MDDGKGEGFDPASGGGGGGRDEHVFDMNEDVEGFDPVTGEVHGPEGQPIGPGNGSVVIREINSEKVTEEGRRTFTFV